MCVYNRAKALAIIHFLSQLEEELYKIPLKAAKLCDIKK